MSRESNVERERILLAFARDHFVYVKKADSGVWYITFPCESDPRRYVNLNDVEDALCGYVAEKQSEIRFRKSEGA